MCRLFVHICKNSVTLPRQRTTNHPLCSMNIMTAEYYIIKQERFNQGMSQAELARKAGISLKTLVNAERGRSISPRSNYAIRKALGLK